MMVVVMAMGQRGHYEQILGDRGASVNRYSLSGGWDGARTSLKMNTQQLLQAVSA
jgi:hypothetical protein